MGLDLTEEFDQLKAYARTMAIPYRPEFHELLSKATDTPTWLVEGTASVVAVQLLKDHGALVERYWGAGIYVTTAGFDLMNMWDDFYGRRG